MSRLTQDAEDRAVQALRYAVKHPDAEGGVNLQDAVAEIAKYVLTRLREEQEKAPQRSVNPNPQHGDKVP